MLTMSESTRDSNAGEFTVSDELYEVSEATNADGTVSVEVFDYKKINNEKIEVCFYTPTMDEKTEVMDWPRIDEPEKYKFVRICEVAVGGLNAADWLRKDGAKIKADPDDWTLIPESAEEGMWTTYRKKKLIWGSYLYMAFSFGFLMLYSLFQFSGLLFLVSTLLFIGFFGTYLDKYTAFTFDDWEEPDEW